MTAESSQRENLLLTLDLPHQPLFSTNRAKGERSGKAWVWAPQRTLGRGALAQQ